MMERKRHLIFGCIWLLCFAIFTLLVKTVDVQSIGAEGSLVGFATGNRWVKDVIGVHLWWYHVTDWLGLLSVGVGLGFAALGAVQLFRRRSLWQVDRDILWLGVLYLVMGACYLLFERFPVNYRPVILDGSLESSYPSSHTLLTICVMATAIFQGKKRLQGKLRRWAVGFCIGVLVVTVVGRVIAGVHWVTDILGAILLGMSLVELYRAAAGE